MSDEARMQPGSQAWREHYGVRPRPSCPRCGTTPPEIVEGSRGPECADCGSQAMDLFLWPEQDAIAGED